MSQQSTLPASAATQTARLLACGIAAGPLFLTVGLTQAFIRDGFDLSRHPLSLLSLGDLGWVQITNFVVTGGLFLACAVGMGRAWVPARAAPGARGWSAPSGPGWPWRACSSPTPAPASPRARPPGLPR